MFKPRWTQRAAKMPQTLNRQQLLMKKPKQKSLTIYSRDRIVTHPQTLISSIQRQNLLLHRFTHQRNSNYSLPAWVNVSTISRIFLVLDYGDGCSPGPTNFLARKRATLVDYACLLSIFIWQEGDSNY